jgi:DNA-binding transcriptional LysR family regulator
MRISTLRYFYEVAQIKSISKVAAIFHISQPALSNQLFKLESEFGEKLFERSNRGVELTEKGEILYEYAKEIIMQYDNLLQDMKSESPDQRKIKISISNIYANYVVNKVSNSIIKIFSETDVYINNDYIANENAMLLNNRAELAVGCSCICDPDLISDYVGTDRMILVSRKNIDKSKIDNMPIALLNDRVETAGKVNAKVKYENIVLRTDSLEILKGYIYSNKCIGILPRMAISDDLESKSLVNLDASEYEWDYNLYVTYRKDMDSKMKNSISQFRDSLEEAINESSIKSIV